MGRRLYVPKKGCSKCGSMKPLGEFRTRKLKDGTRTPTSWCRLCLNAKVLECIKRRYRSDPEFRIRHNAYSHARQQLPEVKAEKREKERARRAGDPEVKRRANERTRQWTKENPDRARENQRRWVRANPDKVRAYGLKWRTANREFFLESLRLRAGMRRWRMFNQGVGRVTQWQAILLLEFWEHKCAYCGMPVTATPTSRSGGYDHVVPLTKGGGHEPGNVVACCHRCNARKSQSLLPDELFEKLVPQMERFVGLLPSESYGAHRGSWAKHRAVCVAAIPSIRALGVPVGIAW